jgi:AraC family transcriptional regulator of adaptative response/methylated-DNA-[protein]-cysteine methyltransferase
MENGYMSLSAMADLKDLERDPRWAAVRARDPAADGSFYYSVRTTGVYCRPSCKSRPARRENVRFHATRKDAEEAGFRPCKRCRPDRPSQAERQAAVVAAACRRIENSETVPTLTELAADTGWSPGYFQRLFKAVAGVTPKEYAAALRAGRVRAGLERGHAVTDAIVAAGYGSGSRFYETANQRLGMTPSRYRAGGLGVAIRFAIAESTLGSVLVAATDRGICAIMLGDDGRTLARELKARFPHATVSEGDRRFAQLVGRVVSLVEKPGVTVELPLDIRGTAFQQRVWKTLRDIPVGATASYAEIATRIGSPGAARAVAGACAANPLAVVIPCHRVVRSDGSLSGYRWGVERKRTLLARESRRK